MSLADRLEESLGHVTDREKVRSLSRLISGASSHAARMRLVTEAFETGSLSKDVYSAAVSIHRSGARPDDLVGSVVETLRGAPSGSLSEMDAFWRARSEAARMEASMTPDALFESALSECECDDDEEEEEDDDED